MSVNVRRAGERSWIGRDMARARSLGARPQRRPVAWLIFTILVCALGLAALRIDILRARYALAEAIREEKSLQQEQRQWTAQVETLRDPARLAELARKRGFDRPSRILELRSHTPNGRRP